MDGGAPSCAIAEGNDAALFKVDAATGVLSFVDPALSGVYDVIVRASDGQAATDQAVAVTVPSALRAIGEVTELTVGTSWLTLDFANEYIDPVVFALAPSLNEADAAATRFKNITGAGAEIRLQEIKKVIDPETGLQISNPGDHAGESVTLLVLGEAFDEAPLVVASLASYNGTDTSRPRIGSVTATRFHAAATEDASCDLETNHGYESVDWMAFSAAGTIFAAPDSARPRLCAGRQPVGDGQLRRGL